MSTYYDKVFLEMAKLHLTYDIGASVKRIPANAGKTISWTRFSPLAAATTPLTEATNPSAVDPTTTAVTAALAEYGNYITVSSLLSMTSIDDELKGHVENIAVNAGETIDELIEAELNGNGTDQFAGGNAAVSDVAATDVLDGAEVRQAVLDLKQAKAPRFEDGMYKAIVPVTSVYDLRADSEWTDAFKYTDAANIKNGEAGTLHGVKFYETNNETLNAGAGASSADIYTTYIFGKGAYGTVSLDGQEGSRVYVKNPTDGDTSNPLDLYSTVGWKAVFAVKVLEATWLREVQCGTASA